LKLIGFGAAVGLAGSVAASRYIQTLLFDIRPNDPATLASVLGLVIIAGTIAILVPAYRASRVDPMVALRHE
jgi:ABC-type antimicrobial peptide transport system permease subunit